MLHPDESKPPLLPIALPGKDHQTLRQLLGIGPRRRLNRIRELRKALRMGYNTIQNCEENPSLLTLENVFGMAALLNLPVEVVLGHLLREIKSLPPELHPLAPIKRGGVGQPRLAHREQPPAKPAPGQAKNEE